ncbi:MAG: hypothetical protein P8Z36_12490 [Gemmatimonadota bacterium]
MRITDYDRVRDVPEPVWTAATPPDFFFRLPFLEVMQESGVEGARYRYLILRQGDQPVGAAVLTAFTLRLDLLAGEAWIRALRRWLPRLLDVPIICCGIPASYGQHHFHVREGIDVDAAVRLVHRYMMEWAEAERCGMLFWKEWNRHQAPHAALRRAGYTPLPTLPDHRLSLPAAGFDHFVCAMRSSYRRKYRNAVALFGQEGPVQASGPFVLEDSPFAPRHVEAFYHGYTQVMERTPVRLETYPRAFFARLADSTVDARQLCLMHTANKESLAALLYPGRDALTFGLVSKEKATYGASLYTLLLQCITLYALRRGYREVRLGQTSSYAKCSVGARPWRLETLVRMRAGWQQRVLQGLGPRFFPEVEVPQLRVFRNGAGR